MNKLDLVEENARFKEAFGNQNYYTMLGATGAGVRTFLQAGEYFVNYQYVATNNAGKFETGWGLIYDDAGPILESQQVHASSQGVGLREVWALNEDVVVRCAITDTCAPTAHRMRGVTTDGVTTDLPGGFTPENDVVQAFSVLVAAARDAGVSGATEGKAWLITGAVRRTTGGAPTILGTPTVTVLGEDAGASFWSATVVVQGYFVVVRVQGESGKTVNWAAEFLSALAQVYTT